MTVCHSSYAAFVVHVLPIRAARVFIDGPSGKDVDAGETWRTAALYSCHEWCEGIEGMLECGVNETQRILQGNIHDRFLDPCVLPNEGTNETRTNEKCESRLP